MFRSIREKHFIHDKIGFFGNPFDGDTAFKLCTSRIADVECFTADFIAHHFNLYGLYASVIRDLVYLQILPAIVLPYERYFVASIRQQFGIENENFLLFILQAQRENGFEIVGIVRILIHVRNLLTNCLYLRLCLIVK